MIEDDERLQQVFPWRLADGSQAGDQHSHLLCFGHSGSMSFSPRAAISSSSTNCSAGGNSQSSSHVERRSFLKGVYVTPRPWSEYSTPRRPEDMTSRWPARAASPHRHRSRTCGARRRRRRVALEHGLSRPRQARVVMQPLQVFGREQAAPRANFRQTPAGVEHLRNRLESFGEMIDLSAPASMSAVGR